MWDMKGQRTALSHSPALDRLLGILGAATRLYNNIVLVGIGLIDVGYPNMGISLEARISDFA